MSRHWQFGSLALLLSLILAACTSVSTQPHAGLQRQDAYAQTSPNSNSSHESAQRVVALTSLSADIIYSLDKTKLVGRPGSRLLSQDERFDKIPVVSQGRSQPNLEKIVALKPDLVVGAPEFHEQTVSKLKHLGITTLLSNVDSWSALEGFTKTLAKSIKADPEPLLKQYQTFLEPNLAESPSTLVLVSRQPILSPNKASWTGDMLAKFNVRNLVAQLQGQSPMRGYISLSAEKILQADPEVLILVETGDRILEQFKSQSFWSKLRAVKNNRVYVFDYYGLVNPGSIEAIEKASTKLKQVLSGKEQES